MVTSNDPYSGHDPVNTARFAGQVALVYGGVLLALTPVASDGRLAAGVLAALAGVVALVVGIVLVRGRIVGYGAMLAGSYVGVAVVIGLQALFGHARGDLLTELFLLIGLQTGSVHPWRRTVGVLAAMAVGLVLHEQRAGLDVVATADLITHLGIWALVAMIANSLTSQMRGQRAIAREKEAVAQDLASTDALTGLGNRRRLVTELEAALASGRPHALALFDLDGFKAYNDSFGHPAGDALLRKLGGNLAATLENRGGAFRMGGDEFCILVAADGSVDAARAIADAAQALTEHGEAFSIGASFGFVELPREAGTTEEALRDADRRMYANKAGGRTSAGRQSTDVLLRVLQERNPDLGEHVQDVTALCARVGGELGLPADDLAALLQAAALHDVGKTAIPDAILNKPGPLTDDEWAFMRQHTVAGERIMAAAPSLAHAARLVRSSHERVDGGGYPDGLVGAAIPLGARIIAVCDALDAMTTDRPYSRAISQADAMAELQRCSGAQFDAGVVDALRAVLAVAPAA